MMILLQAQHFSTEALGSSFGHLTANGQPRFALSGFTLAVLMQLMVNKVHYGRSASGERRTK